jgi:hypothetical protein
MSNPYRAELLLPVADQTYKVQLTFERLIQLEQKLGCSILTLAECFSEGRPTLNYITSVLYAGLSQEDQKVITEETLGNHIVQKGISFYVKQAVILLTWALGGYEPLKKN